MKKCCFIILCVMTMSVHSLCQSVVAAEYFWDNDPGIGMANPLGLGSAGPSITENFNISTTGLSKGEHLLCVRTRDSNGNWSDTENKSVYVHQFTSAEYFWDEDPGLGNGNELALNTSNTDVTSTYVIPTSTIREGWHILYTRSNGFADNWSNAKGTDVFIENKIVAAEYFWNEDPGVGNGTSLDIGTAGADITFTDEVTTVGLDTTQDIHYLVARTMGQNGAWSVFMDTLIFLGPESVEDFVVDNFHNVVYPNPAHSSTTISLFSVSRRNISIHLENLSGERIENVYTGPVSGRKDIQLDLSPFASGIYLMHYTTDQYDWTTKLIVD